MLQIVHIIIIVIILVSSFLLFLLNDASRRVEVDRGLLVIIIIFIISIYFFGTMTTIALFSDNLDAFNQMILTVKSARSKLRKHWSLQKDVLFTLRLLLQLLWLLHSCCIREHIARRMNALDLFGNYLSTSTSFSSVSINLDVFTAVLRCHLLLLL